VQLCLADGRRRGQMLMVHPHGLPFSLRVGDHFLEVSCLLATAAGRFQNRQPLVRRVQLTQLDVELTEIFVGADMFRLQRQRALIILQRFGGGRSPSDLVPNG
jgi:hypothetical protein